MPNRIHLSDSLFPVQAFFNALSDSSFLRVIEDMTKGIGSSIDVCHCNFPGDLDPGEEPFEGVSFSIYEEEVILSKDNLVKYVVLACDEFLKNNPDKINEVEKVLLKF